MIKSFEEVIEQQTASPTPPEPPTDSDMVLDTDIDGAQTQPTENSAGELVWPVAISGMVLYVSLTAFTPYIAARNVTELPLYFSAAFFVVTFAYLLAWGFWAKLSKKLGLAGIRLSLPLLAIPVSIGLFYLLSLF